MKQPFNSTRRYFDLRDREVPRDLANIASGLRLVGMKPDPKSGVVCPFGILLSCDEVVEA